MTNICLSSIQSELKFEYIFDSAIESEVCRDAINKLLPCFKEMPVVTGGVATALHLLRFGKTFPPKSLKDLDIVVPSQKSLSSIILQNYLVNHFHPTRGPGKTLIQLVDEQERVRIDVFTPYSPSFLDRVVTVKVGSQELMLLGVEDLVARLACVLYPMGPGESVDPKHYRSFLSLSDICDMSEVRRLWLDYRNEGSNKDYDQAVRKIHEEISSNPEYLQDDCYERGPDSICDWCVESKDFPLSSKEKVFDILGYV